MRSHEKYGVHRSVVVAFAVAALASPFSIAEARHRVAAPSTGLPKIAFQQLAPEFSIEAADGSATKLLAFAGRPVVLNFWATWCAPCADELATFARLQKAYGRDVVLITVSDQDRAVTKPFLEAHGVADAVSVADPDRKIFDLYGVTALPVTLVLGRDGKVGHVSVGELDWAELETAVDAASSPPPSPAPRAT